MSCKYLLKQLLLLLLLLNVLKQTSARSANDSDIGDSASDIMADIRVVDRVSLKVAYKPENLSVTLNCSVDYPREFVGWVRQRRYIGFSMELDVDLSGDLYRHPVICVMVEQNITEQYLGIKFVPNEMPSFNDRRIIHKQAILDYSTSLFNLIQLPPSFLARNVWHKYDMFLNRFVPALDPIDERSKLIGYDNLLVSNDKLTNPQDGALTYYRCEVQFPESVDRSQLDLRYFSSPNLEVGGVINESGLTEEFMTNYDINGPSDTHNGPTLFKIHTQYQYANDDHYKTGQRRYEVAAQPVVSSIAAIPETFKYGSRITVFSRSNLSNKSNVTWYFREFIANSESNEYVQLTESDSVGFKKLNDRAVLLLSDFTEKNEGYYKIVTDNDVSYANLRLAEVVPSILTFSNKRYSMTRMFGRNNRLRCYIPEGGKVENAIWRIRPHQSSEAFDIAVNGTGNGFKVSRSGSRTVEIQFYDNPNYAGYRLECHLGSRFDYVKIEE